MTKTAEWKNRYLKIQIKQKGLKLTRTRFVFRPEYPTFYVSRGLTVEINLAAFPAKISFEDTVYHIIKGDLCERLCFLLNIKMNKQYACKTKKQDCQPARLAIRVLTELEFNPKSQYFDDYECEDTDMD